MGARIFIRPVYLDRRYMLRLSSTDVGSFSGQYCPIIQSFLRHTRMHFKSWNIYTNPPPPSRKWMIVCAPADKNYESECELCVYSCVRHFGFEEMHQKLNTALNHDYSLLFWVSPLCLLVVWGKPHQQKWTTGMTPGPPPAASWARIIVLEISCHIVTRPIVFLPPSRIQSGHFPPRPLSSAASPYSLQHPDPENPCVCVIHNLLLYDNFDIDGTLVYTNLVSKVLKASWVSQWWTWQASQWQW